MNLEKSETSGSSAVPTAAKLLHSKYRSTSGTVNITRDETSSAAAKPLHSKYRSTSSTVNMTRDETSSERSVPLDTGENGKRGVGAIDSSRPGKRSRKQNVVTNASTFGDIGYTTTDNPEMVQRSTVIPVKRGQSNSQRSAMWPPCTGMGREHPQ